MKPAPASDGGLHEQATPQTRFPRHRISRGTAGSGVL